MLCPYACLRPVRRAGNQHHGLRQVHGSFVTAPSRQPSVGQFGAGGGSAIEQLETEASDDAIRMVQRYLALGLPLVMIESEGLTENVRAPRYDVIAKIVAALGVNRVMFEAADPTVFMCT